MNDKRGFDNEFRDTSAIEVGRGFLQSALKEYRRRASSYRNSYYNRYADDAFCSLDDLRTVSYLDYIHMTSIVNYIGIKILHATYDQIHEELARREALHPDVFVDVSYAEKAIKIPKNYVFKFYREYHILCKQYGMNETIKKDDDFIISNFSHLFRDFLYESVKGLYIADTTTVTTVVGSTGTPKPSKSGTGISDEVGVRTEELDEEDSKYRTDPERIIFNMETLGLGPEYDKNIRFLSEIYNAAGGREQVFDAMQSFRIHSKAAVPFDEENRLVFVTVSGDIQVFDYDLSTRGEGQDLDDREEYYTYVPFLTKGGGKRKARSIAYGAKCSRTGYLPTNNRPVMKNDDLGGVMFYSLKLFRSLIRETMDFQGDVMGYKDNRVTRKIITEYINGLLSDDDRTIIGQKGIKNDIILLSKIKNSYLYFIDCETANIVTIPAISPKDIMGPEDHDLFSMLVSRYEINESNLDEKDYVISVVKNTVVSRNGVEQMHTSFMKRSILRPDKQNVKRSNIDKDGFSDEDLELVNTGFGLFFRDKEVALKCQEKGNGTYEGIFSYCCQHKVFDHTMRGRWTRFKFEVLDQSMDVVKKHIMTLIPIAGTMLGVGIATLKSKLIKKKVEKLTISGGKALLGTLMPPIAKVETKLVVKTLASASKSVISKLLKK